MKVSKTKKIDKLPEPEKTEKSAKIKAARIKKRKVKQGAIKNTAVKTSKTAPKEKPQNKPTPKKAATVSAKKAANPAPEKTKKTLKKTSTPRSSQPAVREKTRKITASRKVPVKPAKKEIKTEVRKTGRTQKKDIVENKAGIAERKTPAQSRKIPAAAKPAKAGLKIFLPEEMNRRIFSEGLNEEFGENELIVMAVDPDIVFIDWEIRPEDIYGEDGELCLRVYDVTGVTFDGLNANSSFDLKISKRVSREFINLGMHGREVIVDAGIIGADSRFKTIMRSGIVAFPELLISDELGIARHLFNLETPLGY